MNGIGIRPNQTTAYLAAILGTLVVTACSSTPADSPSPPEIKIEPTPAALIRDDGPVLGPPRRVKLADEEAPTWHAEGLYLGVFGAYEDIVGDDYGDDNVLVGSSDIIIIPDVDGDTGYGAMISYRWRRWELYSSYSQFEHDSDFAGQSHDYDANWLDFNFRYYFWVNGAIQPFLLAGGGLSSAKIDDGSTDGIVTENGHYEDGISLNLGGGLAFFPLPWVYVYGQAQYRFAKYKASDGVDGKLSSDIDADTWEVSAGAMIRILPGMK
jgi:opacity protein-like surface antigen